jgi:hypothetical protein
MSKPNKNLGKNASGCNDPVACTAISKTDKERQRLTKLMETIFNICELSGFHLEERIVLRDKKTGKIWR